MASTELKGMNIKDLSIALAGNNNPTSRGDESIESSGVVMPADQLGSNQSIPSFSQPPVQSNFASQLQQIQQQALQIQDTLNSPQQQTNDFRSQIQSGVTDLLNRDVAGESQSIRDSFGLQDKEKLARELSNDATRIKRDYEARIRDARQNDDGKLRGALQAEIDDLTTQGNLNLSEKMFQYSIANGDFQQAEKLALQAISDLESADARRLNLLKTAYDFVQNDLSESEKLQINQEFDKQQTERKAQLNQLQSQFAYDLGADQRAFDNQIKQDQLNIAIQKLNQDNVDRKTATQAQLDKLETSRQSTATSGQIVIKNVKEALLQSNQRGTTGFIGGNTQKINGTPAYNLAQTIQTIKANLGFDELQKMRESSPTGGALGQVAVQELEALQATVGSLQVGQSQEQLQGNLADVEEHYTAFLEAIGYNVAPNGDVIEIIN